MKVLKASGKTQTFNEEKILDSSIRAGASKELAKEALLEVKKGLQKDTPTEEIYNDVLVCLRNKDQRVAARYSLKRAIMRLGPAGYVFEKYIGAILSQYGYKTATGIVVEGHCISHEIDLIAKKDGVHILGEAKYHNRPGVHSGAKDALYSWARFQDIKKRMESVETPKADRHEGWLITNTRVSKDVKDYAACVGMKVLSWRYPKNKGLEHYIENKGLYPITIIPSLHYKELERLSKHKTIFATDLLTYNVEKLARVAGMNKKKAKKVLDEINTICLP